jgi:hypothetical protein
MEPEVHNCDHKSPPPVRILNQINPIRKIHIDKATFGRAICRLTTLRDYVPTWRAT